MILIKAEVVEVAAILVQVCNCMFGGKSAQYCSCPWELHDVPLEKPRLNPKPRTSIEKQKKSLSFAETPVIIPPQSHVVGNISHSNRVIIQITDACENINLSNKNVGIELNESIPTIEEKKVIDDKILPQPEIRVLEDEKLPEIPETSSNPHLASQFENEALSTSNLDSSHQLLLQMYQWYPPDLTGPNLEKFMSSIPPEYRPIVDTEGAQNCRISLLSQLPPQDSDYEMCHPLSEKEIGLMNAFVEQREKRYRGQGIVKGNSKGNCFSCTEHFGKDELCIFAPLLGSNHNYHIGCFRCSKCLQFLQELHYYKKDKNIYCGRHHAELFGHRCAGL